MHTSIQLRKLLKVVTECIVSQLRMYFPILSLAIVHFVQRIGGHFPLAAVVVVVIFDNTGATSMRKSCVEREQIRWNGQLRSRKETMENE
jgi:hypothetical protein